MGVDEARDSPAKRRVVPRALEGKVEATVLEKVKIKVKGGAQDNLRTQAEADVVANPAVGAEGGMLAAAGAGECREKAVGRSEGRRSRKRARARETVLRPQVRRRAE